MAAINVISDDQATGLVKEIYEAINAQLGIG